MFPATGLFGFELSPLCCRPRGRAILASLAMIMSVPSARSIPAQTVAKTMAGSCAPANKAEFVCGVRNVEDLAALYPTSWIIGSNAHDLAKVGDVLYLFDGLMGSVEPIQPSSISVRPDATRFPTCPGVPNFAAFQTFGLSFRAGAAGHDTLLVINHGGRDTIEAFDLDQMSTHPHLTWVGCIPEPAHTYGDAVSELSDGGVVATSTFDPADHDIAAKVLSGKPVGSVNEWHKGSGWASLVGTEELSFPNGVVLSPDDKTIYLAASGTSQVLKYDRERRRIVSASRPFTTSAIDNVRWSPDGTLIYVGGEVGTLKSVLACSSPSAPPCKVGAEVYALDPDTLRYVVILPPALYGSFGMGTGAVLEGKTLWVSSAHSDRVALYPLPESNLATLQRIKREQK